MFQKRPKTTTSEILIIGGGVIGVCSAYYLLQKGFSVTLLEKDQINAGSTYGNAGLIIPSDSLPVPAPGALTQGLRWLLDSASPFYIKPTLDPDVLRWLWGFQGACREGAWRRAAPLLTQLSVDSVPLFEEIIQQEGIDCHYQREGLLLLYEKEPSLRAGMELLEKLSQYQIQGEVLRGEHLQQQFHPTRSEIAGGIYFEPDAHLDPAVFTAQLANCCLDQGLQLVEDCEVLGFEWAGSEISAVITTRGAFQAEQVVLAAGAWTQPLAKQLGLRLPVQPAKGYSITFERPENYPEIPLLLDEAKIAVTPLGDSLRFAGTLELAGLNLDINQKRVQAILDNAARYLSVDLNNQPLVEIWRGLRPCTPDGLPIIGRSRKVTNLIPASGHCMLGVSQGTMTGKLVSRIAAGEKSDLDLDALSPDRF
jgi:D-amino-acid dehydrogenase